MAADNRDVLEVLKFELSFLEYGGYGRSPHASWRAPAIFEDSPICPNFTDPVRRHPCKQCLLIDFVPQARRNEEVPCRFIQLRENGETVDELYRTGTQIEMEKALAGWLRTEIHRIERERATANAEGCGFDIIPS